MRVLLDECLPRRLKRDLAGHAVRTVPEAGWAGRDNGDLLALAETQFDVFVTIEQHLASQQRVPKFRIAVVVLSAPSNRYEDLRPPSSRNFSTRSPWRNVGKSPVSAPDYRQHVGG